MTLLFISSHNSVDRTPAQSLGGHELDSCQGLRFFLFLINISFPSLKFTIFIHLSIIIHDIKNLGKYNVVYVSEKCLKSFSSNSKMEGKGPAFASGGEMF